MVSEDSKKSESLLDLSQVELASLQRDMRKHVGFSYIINVVLNVLRASLLLYSSSSDSKKNEFGFRTLT